MNTTTPAAVLTAATARRLTSEIRNALGVADELLARAFAGRVWSALGHADWPAYCAAELPELRHLKLRAGPRRERVAALLEQGATVRDIAAATGASVGTAHGDIATITTAGGLGCLRTVGSNDTPCAPAHVRAAAVVAAAGGAGLTIPQVQRRLGWTPGATSGALARAERRGLVHRPLELPRRGVYRPYVAVSP